MVFTSRERQFGEYAEAHMDKVKIIVQSSNGNLRDKVWKIMGIAEPVLILPRVIVAGQDVKGTDHPLGVATCRWARDCPPCVHL